MSKSIKTIEGVGESYGVKLQALGIKNVEQLLEQGSTPKGRKELADKTGISDKLILKWVNHADLFRIRGIAGQYAELLEAAGVDTVVELAQRRGDNLFAKIKEKNTERKLVRQLPPQASVSEWIEQAKNMPRVVSY